jgi:hypothetical protein
MSKNEKFDEFIKKQFSNSSPEVPSRVWENIMAAKERRKPKAFWWTNLADSKSILVGVVILIGCFSVTWMITHHINNSTKTTLASSSLGEKNNTSTIDNNINTQKQNSLQSSSLIASKNTNISIQSSSPNNTTTSGFSNSINNNTSIANNNSVRRHVKNIRSGIRRIGGINVVNSVDNENSTNGTNNEETPLANNKDEQTTDDLSQVATPSSSIAPVLTFIAGSNDALKRNKGLALPECPTVEKAPSRERDYVEFYGSPDYGIRTLSDPGNPQYVKARDSSSHFTSGYSFGVSYTKVFKNGLSLREGLNYSQINEWFTAAKNNSFTVYSIDQAGDTLGKTVTYKVTHNHYSTIDIPLTVGYEFAVGKTGRFVANINGGVIINVFSWQNGDVLDTANNTVHITTSSANYSPYLFKTVMGAGLTGDISLYYKLSDMLSVVAEPYVRYNFQPMTQNTSSFSEKYTTIGLRLGVRIDLH